jgi:hypothetical protein
MSQKASKTTTFRDIFLQAQASIAAASCALKYRWLHSQQSFRGHLGIVLDY